ncbi:MAG: enoyl-CoA hydratase-related protein [Candidatus Bipolaricaulia bacterium]
MAYQQLKLDQDGPVAFVTLNRPDVRNAFNAELIDELTECFRELSGDSELRAVVIGGAGKAFCAGADLNWMRDSIDQSEAANREGARRMAAMFRTVDEAPFPVIGRVQKAAFGGGLGLVCVCDVVVADDDATFSFSETRLGLAPAVIAPFALRKVGLAQARRYFLSAEVFSAADAQRLGLVHEVCDEAELDEHVKSFTNRFLKNGPNAVREAKAHIHRMAEMPFEEALEDSAGQIAQLRTSEEGQEGVRAFLEKRTPSWAITDDDDD